MRRSQPNAEEGLLLERYMQAWQAANLDGLIELLREDATYRMPPWREWYQGRGAIRGLFENVWANFAGFRTVAIGANARPAVGVYARTHQDPAWRAHSLHVIEPADGGIASLTVYLPPLGPKLFPAFGLPPAHQYVSLAQQAGCAPQVQIPDKFGNRAMRQDG